jgi:hypothetical protein
MGSLDESACEEIFVYRESGGWVEHKYKVTRHTFIGDHRTISFNGDLISYLLQIFLDPSWTGNTGQPATPDFITILSDPHTQHRYRQVRLRAILLVAN